MRLTLIRHAPTVYSSAGLLMGERDIPATPDGIGSAKQLGERLSGIHFDRCFSSPLERAMQTARVLFPNLDVEPCVLLRERRLGIWAGRDKQELRQAFPGAFMNSGFLDPEFTPPGGEPTADLLERARQFLGRVSTGNNDHHVVAVTHNGVMRAIRCVVGDLPVTALFAGSEHYLTPRTYSYDDSQWRHVAVDSMGDSASEDPIL